MCTGNLMVTSMYIEGYNRAVIESSRKLAETSPIKAFNAIVDWRQDNGCAVHNKDLQALAILVSAIKPERRIHLCEDRVFRVWYPGQDAYTGQSAWISPKGMVYPVGYAGHQCFYWYLCGLSESDFEKAGWIHVSGGRCDMYGNTSMQLKAIEELPGEHRQVHCDRYGEPSEKGRELLKKLDRVPRKDFDPQAFFASLERREEPEPIPAPPEATPVTKDEMQRAALDAYASARGSALEAMSGKATVYRPDPFLFNTGV